jgi:hypothetical protein
VTTILELNSDRWRSLDDAYGEGARIPILLRELESAPDAPRAPQAKPWNTLWSSLCHQSDVYTASYAALPHLVRIAAMQGNRDTVNQLLLPIAIEIFRHKRESPSIPVDLVPAYEVALENLRALVIENLTQPVSRSELTVLLAGLAALNAWPELGSTILDNDALVCPHCEQDVTFEQLSLLG